MASSLLFRIKSTFDGTGVRAAQASFKSTLGLIGRLTVGTAKLALTFSNLGVALALVGTVQAVKLTKNLLASNQEAINAEQSFTRLRIQLNLIGQESTQNIKRIQQFAIQTADATRFSVRQVQEATAIALRRTGDLGKAIRQVSIAQDISAVTGRDLIRTTRLLNLAQAGNVRILTQITNLRRADIQAAVRQGTLLDLLAEKFGGAASREASTLASRLTTLRNAQELLNAEIGAIGIPFRIFTTNVAIFVAQTATKLVKSLTDIRTSIAGPQGFARALIEAFSNKDLDAAIDKTSGRIFDFNKELEIRTLRLGRSREELRNLARLVVKIEQDLLQAQQVGTRTLTEAQIERINAFKFAQQELQAILRSETEGAQETFNALQKQRNQLAQEQASPLAGIPAVLSEIPQKFRDLRQAGLSAREATELILGDLKGIVRTQIDLVAGILNANREFNKTEGSVKNVNTALLDALNILEDIGRATPGFGQRLATAVEARLKPLSNVTINLNLTEEQIKAAVADGARTGLQGTIARLVRNAVNAGREQRAQENFG